MRHYLLSILFLILFTTTFSQSKSDLDSKYGFRKFRFGMTPSQIGNLTPYSVRVNMKNVDVYKCSGDEVSELRGVKIQSITLYFYKQKLYRISVEFGSPVDIFSEIDYQVINDSLIASFGTGYSITNKYQGEILILNTSIWDGRKVRLEHTRLNYKPNANDRYNRVVGYILLLEKDMDEQQKRDELF